MTVHLKHKFINGHSDGADPTLTQPSNWNDDHTLSCASGKILGSDTSGPASVQELPLTFFPSGDATFSGATGFVQGAVGTTAQRPSAAAGMERWNSDTIKKEFYDGSAWQNVATETYVTAAIAAAVAFSTGDVKLTLKITPDVGWLMFADQTIGSALSGATFADPAAQDLFELLWNNVTDTWAPVNGGRGANAAADWAANKKMQLLTTLGHAFAMAGAGAGLTARPLGSSAGAETHSVTAGEIPLTTGSTTPSTGGGAVQGVTPQAVTPIPTVQPTTFFNAMVKL